MCYCTPNIRKPCCNNCPYDEKVKWGLCKSKINEKENIPEALKEDAINSIRRSLKYSNKKFESFNDLASNSIMNDVCDRGLLKIVFGEIERDNPELYNDIKKTWSYIIKECFERFN